MWKNSGNNVNNTLVREPGEVAAPYLIRLSITYPQINPRQENKIWPIIDLVTDRTHIHTPSSNNKFI